MFLAARRKSKMEPNSSKAATRFFWSVVVQKGCQPGCILDIECKPPPWHFSGFNASQNHPPIAAVHVFTCNDDQHDRPDRGHLSQRHSKMPSAHRARFFHGTSTPKMPTSPRPCVCFTQTVAVVFSRGTDDVSPHKRGTPGSGGLAAGSLADGGGRFVQHCPTLRRSWRVGAVVFLFGVLPDVVIHSNDNECSVKDRSNVLSVLGGGWSRRF